ncbi:MAG: RraA family protein [Ginsengibacter sp.]
MNKKLVLFAAFVLMLTFAKAQTVGSSPGYIKALTADWKGERFADGRPKVSDAILKRLKHVAMEEAWGYLRSKGFNNQYEGNWQIINPDSAMTGRVVTAQYMPSRPDFVKLIKQTGVAEGRDSSGGTNSWPINVLKPGDVYVADGYERIIDGTLIGSNLGNAIYANSQNGVIFNASVRDMAGLKEIKGFNGWVKGIDPSYLQEEMLTSINTPIRVGRAIVLPGDVVLANQYGTIFIPANFIDELVISSEVTALRDEFGFQRLKEKKYLAGQIDSRWSDEITKDFVNWIKNYPDSKLPMTRKELNDFLDSHKYND